MSWRAGVARGDRLSDSGAADAEDEAGAAAVPPPFVPVRVVPTRPEWLGRRPISSVDRDRILKDLSADQEELDAVQRREGLRLAPLFSSVTI
ncbi:hypothetical protein ABZV14_40015 [Streptosporangium canum]|uniref:hypothetical protein n=1 Tax=Streptosporangium canum TaxID=324952 RepID=UPI00339E0981